MHRIQLTHRKQRYPKLYFHQCFFFFGNYQLLRSRWLSREQPIGFRKDWFFQFSINLLFFRLFLQLSFAEYFIM
jgi:hypothetical protein